MKYILIVSIVCVLGGCCGVTTIEEDTSIKGDTTFINDTTAVDTTAGYEVRP